MTLPISLGRFQLVPVFTAASFFDDNVFALSSNAVGDWAYVARPSFTLQSKGLKDTDLLAGGFVEFRRYDEFSSEDQNNGAIGVAGQTLLNQNTQLVGRAEYIHGHEDRGASETITPSSSWIRYLTIKWTARSP